MKTRAITKAVVLAFAAAAALGIGPKPGRERNVAILIFPGVQIIDYTGPWEVFGHASVDGQPAFRMYSVSQTLESVTTSMGMSVNPTFTLATAPKPDVLVLPGGAVPPQLEDPVVVGWVRENAKRAEIVFSVCNGAFFLAKAGLLDGLEATTFAGLIDELRVAAPKTRVVTEKRFVDNGKIVTAAGLSSGIDGALHVIERLLGRGTAQVVAVELEYDWRPDSGYARASLADRYLSAGYAAIREYSRSVIRHEGTREHWETSWKISTDASAAAVLARLDRAFGNADGWVRATPGTDARAGARSQWRYEEPGNGRRWIESTRVEPLPAGAKGYLVTLAVSQSKAAPASARN